MKIITLSEVQYIALQYDKDNLIDEDNRVFFRSCVHMPFLKRDSVLINESYRERASILFYQLIMNRPFKKDNDKIAATTLFYYLSKHNRWLEVDTTVLYNFIQWIKTSLPEVKEGAIQAVSEFLERYIVKFPG